MYILGVESSCDETALAIVKDGREVFASLIASQTATHAQWGGVVPEIAAREHLTALHDLHEQLLMDSGMSSTDMDAIAVAQGPGLIGCLLVGVSFAKGLAQGLNRPLIPVNHVHAHIHGALLGLDRDPKEIFPTIALVVSGGHTNLYYLDRPTDYQLLAHTIDDACGESFDKVGKMLGLPYPGGPHVEDLARQGDSSKVAMPTMIERKSQLAFSYSGLKTAAANAIRQPKDGVTSADIAAAFQKEALGQIVRKLSEAIRRRPSAKSIVIAGGVAANQKFRDIVGGQMSLPAYFPPLKYCSDNGAMIAAMAYYEYKDAAKDIAPNSWDVFSRYPFEQYLVQD